MQCVFRFCVSNRAVRVSVCPSRAEVRCWSASLWTITFCVMLKILLIFNGQRMFKVICLNIQPNYLNIISDYFIQRNESIFNFATVFHFHSLVCGLTSLQCAVALMTRWWRRHLCCTTLRRRRRRRRYKGRKCQTSWRPKTCNI